MQEIKRIGALSVAKIFGLFGILLGFLLGLLMYFASTSLSSETTTAGMELVSVFGWKIIILLPVFYGVLYFIIGAITILIYNIFAKWVGGIKVDLTESKARKKKK